MREGSLASLAWFLAFLPMAAVGTVSHEAGHCAAASAVGASWTLHYAWMEHEGGTPGTAWMITAGGPASTILVGTTGILILFRASGSLLRGLGVLLGLFWSREVFNLGTGALLAITGTSPDRLKGDEIVLSGGLGLGLWGLPIACGLAGLAACLLVIRLAPPGWRAPIVLGGVPGCLAGFALWMGVFGPALLP